jgi:hypothetical protein
MTALARETPRFDIGRVVIRTFQTVGRNWTTFGLLALIATAPSYAVTGLRLALGMPIQGAQALAFSGPSFIVSLLGILAAFLAASGLQAALMHGVIADLNGRKPSFAECLRTGLRFLLPLFALNLLIGLGTGLATLLLIVPGVMFGLAWLVAGPVLVAERTGVSASFSRSATLTRGHRWMLFGLLLIYVMAVWILAAAMFALTGGFAALAEQASGVMNWPLMIANAILGLVLSVVGAAGLASIYVELRSMKEGVGPEQLASVFD